ncbi:MAG: hypothetical protein LQ344_000565 [Seirophora lacunosa]|nr:MAG: hypothetical protein LQ344_000565 [Seirophora lacunosa]
MPSERRNLRSNKESSSSTNGEKPRSNSQSSSAKDKPVPTRSTSSRSKASAPVSKKSAASEKEGTGSKPHTNGTDPVENGMNGTDDVDMVDENQEPVKANGAADEEMTVVVPPSKTSRLSSEQGEDQQGDIPMDNLSEAAPAEADRINPKAKTVTVYAATDIKGNYALLERAVSQFDARFTLRVLRSISSIRKHLSSDILAQAITETYPASSPIAKVFLAAIGKEDALFEAADNVSEMEIDSQKDKAKTTSAAKDVFPEVDFYLAILVQIHLYDNHQVELGAKFSTNLVEKLRTLNRRTLDPLSARVYFYYSLFFEQLAPLPPSPSASVVSIRQPLLQALRTSVLRKDQDTRATVTTLLLRNYLSTSHISQADLLISHSEFPAAASNNQIARYLYYLGRIRAIQLSYTEAHEHLIGATRKSPSSHSAGGFYQAASKLLVVVELLMGDIPDRAIFRQASLEHAIQPYLSLVQAVRVGKIDGFLNVVQTHNAVFRRDGTYTLILRLRQNVIKTGIRMMSLSYAKISLRDICMKLDLDSEESAEYIVAKSIRDGVIEATLDHEQAFMKSKEVGDIYATKEPGEAFHDRIQACLALHDESAMRFPMNQHRLELKNAQEARERERELAKEIVEGDMDDDDAGGDFEGM